MTRADARSRALATLIAGIALGAVISAGIALMLYTGQGFLRAAGLLFASTIMAVAAGLWAGAPEQSGPVTTRGRWLALALAFAAGGVFAAQWAARAALRELALGGAIAVLLVLALPAYCAGALLAGVNARDRAARLTTGGGIAAAATAGVAFGVLLSTTLLIPNLEPFGIYYGGAALVAFASLLDRGAHARAAGGLYMIDRVVLVTGASEREQLGYTVARRFLDAGARVVISARSAAVQEIAADLSAFGSITAHAADLSVQDDVDALVAHVAERHGRLDALINVAGGLSVTGAIADTSADDWIREFARNTVTALRLTRAALPLLREAGGAVVNFASPAGLRAVPRLAAYSAAKAGVVALTRALAIEEKASGVRVNAIAPGMMDTGQNRAEAGADAVFVDRDDVANVVLFLAGDAARGITGETIHVPGPTIR
jgi:NAD(P)-dependent dehydrogenase (short-subunit alcohol dehydrogenase family)